MSFRDLVKVCCVVRGMPADHAEAVVTAVVADEANAFMAGRWDQPVRGALTDELLGRLRDSAVLHGRSYIERACPTARFRQAFA